MRSPFPGMDPWIESQAWEDFHHRFLCDIADSLVPSLRPRYIVSAESREYVEAVEDQRGRLDLERRREIFLCVRDRETPRRVAVIEMLTPGNKQRWAKGRSVYLEVRTAILGSPCNLVEIDLLRGGERPPMDDTLPDADYYALVSLGHSRPKALAWAWTVRDPMPKIRFPLDGNAPDCVIDLQSLFQDRFERSGYDFSLDRSRQVEPPLRPDDAAWAASLLDGS